MILNYVETINVREISKKEKFLKLNMNSWIISFLSASFLFVWSLLYGVVLLVALVIMFYILEFFDEDITNIILANLTLKNDTKEYYA
ncbi:virB3 type IV secretion protein [Helicobacter pylori]|uniref:virB3 type IV secretion protein n=1 Tax=Helicobacter pylori TaxID=210 RepID=UPI0013F3EA35|nr:virB3 type IV secretion protein [Helicobacter pylori]NHB15999.1 virB3 type IV secretion protein [Helicobacter pylori]WQU32845.1 virB3 type IV secretion protein [Helicobacter pylori]WQV91055.1 virB3 type IV secretion protein [Helicobacter pylori]